MFPQYSPLFTSGLMSESNTPSSSRRPSLELCEKAPRGSLPVDANMDSFYEASSSTSEEDAVFLTLMPRRRRAEAGNSFLSLDLAESHSMRSMSLRRKDTVTSRATTHFGRSVPTSPDLRPVPIPTAPLSFSHSGLALQSRRSIVRHSSREGLPGVKPVPSSQLPATPPVPRRPRPSDLTITLSTCFSSVSSDSGPSMHRATHSEPSIASPISPIISPLERSYLTFSPPTTPPASAALTSFVDVQRHAPAPAAVTLRARPSVRSSVSIRTRQVNRSAALAALEGRSSSNSHSRQRSRPGNFMSMSDDEDDGDADEIENHGSASTTLPTSGPSVTSLLDVLQEEEDVVVPAARPPKRVSSSTPVLRKSRSRRGTIESLLSPLTNFIDFRDDDRSTRSWRSFVEIS
ncbi:hypothetical protein BC628DRAFT_1014662 [Trametes gibbosa]|nr:hypothetical protein BC628DRAFT_1014662 [Trametes gibbosa]